MSMPLFGEAAANDYGASSVVDEYTYTYDRVGNRMSRDNELDSNFDEDYLYDDVYRLIDFERENGLTRIGTSTGWATGRNSTTTGRLRHERSTRRTKSNPSPAAGSPPPTTPPAT